MLRYSIFLSLLICICFDMAATDQMNDAALLQKLDKMIDRREVYQQQVEKEISNLRRTLIYAEDDKQKFDILGDLFIKYRSFRIDTAMIIAKERLQLAENLRDEEIINQGLMNVADVLNKMGKHENALIELSKVKRTEAVLKDTYFYYLYHTIYLSCYNDEIDTSRRHFYRQELKAYKDTLIAISKPDSPSYITNKCGRLGMSGKWDEAIRILNDYYSQCKNDEPDKARMEYLFAELYLGKQDTLRAKHWLTLAAITDIANAKKVYMSLQRLAILLFQEGDIARAYNYISCSLEDVNFGKARYRIVDIAEYLPIIKAANDARIKTDKNKVLFFLLILSVLVITLVAAFFFIRNKNSNLLRVKQSLAEQNRRLQEMTENLTQMNKEIKESNHIKEEYIGLLFNICSEYIYKQENNRKILLKVVNTGSMADLSKMLNNQSSTSEDFKLFINKFDTIFLSIFPDFIESFNTLLKEEERIQIKENELLTPELRIYALIRLGINDNSKIANFLHYSLQTVYNYRMKMRNKAIIPGKDLAAQVQKL
ncbi:hypothetical protein EII33_10145 [Bacteroides heparinolyticus]|uniref:DUF6377 domain-containing protein n=1 Tax=Prevotella heparinolytica TaxID=28113 RepID=A0A3P2A348_9BACE|nr:DUF6377 domain-containing protein [Bacteroides heparinolyticus]RRD89358.1 hypothetical protein EII33_10145 [Bacteroides heparinolyticus]